MSLIPTSKAQKKLAENLRRRRLNTGLTQEGLADRSGVALTTLRKFEQKGVISLESFLKLLTILGGLEELLKATQLSPTKFSSIDEVLAVKKNTSRQRGRRK